MSKIGSSVLGEMFTPIITNSSFEVLKSLRDNNESIGISNALIFSIPQNNDEDVKDQGSIWVTDNDGHLYMMTAPIASFVTKSS